MKSQATPRQPKIILFGLDSATWDLVRPWCSQGLLPNLSRLVQNGVSGNLESVLPPITPPAWTSFSTGKNPGKHGIFYFLEPQPDSYAMRYSNAGSRRARTIWRMLSDAGLTVGTMNIPFTYPPESLSGFQISGMDTPSETSAFIHPPSLRAELEKEVGALGLDVTHLGFMTNDARRAQVLAELEKIDRQWTKTALYLLEKHPCDVMMFAFMSVDTVQHHFWHFMDANHFLHDPKGATRFGDAILKVYQNLDRSIGEIIKRLPGDTAVLVVSDHGGGPVSDRVVYLNRYLAQLGLLKYQEKPQSGLRKLVSVADKLLRRTLTARQKKLLAGAFPALRERFEGATNSCANIDWTQTKAYSVEGMASPASVFINLKGRRPHGIVEEGEYEGLVTMISQMLTELDDPRTGDPVIQRIYRRAEVYQGPYANEAPDLILDWWSGSGFSTKPSFPADREKSPLEIRERKPMKEAEWGGTHRLQGMFIFNGAASKRGTKIEGARLIDVAPTLLYLLGQKIPADMDGRVLTDLFEPRFLLEHPIHYEEAAVEALQGQVNSTYSEEEASHVEERLKALGYVD